MKKGCEASATVCNQGLVSGSPDLGFYLSHDERIVPQGDPFEVGDLGGSEDGDHLLEGRVTRPHRASQEA